MCVTQDCHINLVLRVVTPPNKLVIVSGNWPASLVLVLAPGFPLQDAFFIKSYHWYFNSPKAMVSSWTSVLFFTADKLDRGPVYLVSGGVDFLQCTLPLLGSSQQLIVTVDVTQCDVSRGDLWRSQLEGHQVLAEHILRTLVIGNAVSGGATDAYHLLEFGTQLHSLVVKRVEPGLLRLV